jgi:hypothetical protein
MCLSKRKNALRAEDLHTPPCQARNSLLISFWNIQKSAITIMGEQGSHQLIDRNPVLLYAVYV